MRMIDWKPDFNSPYNQRGRSDKAICMMCFRPLRGKNHRMIHLVEGNAKILHPADTALYTRSSADGGWFEIGSDCAKKLGMEWSVSVDK